MLFVRPRLLDLAQRYGAVLSRPQSVTRLLRKENRIHALCIDGQQLEFDYVILASGTAVSDLAVTAGITVPQTNVPVFVVETEACKQGFSKIAVMHLFSEQGRYLKSLIVRMARCARERYYIANVAYAGYIAY